MVVASFAVVAFSPSIASPALLAAGGVNRAATGKPVAVRPHQGDKMLGLIISAIVVGLIIGPWAGWYSPAARTCPSGSPS
jgi:hypothetical protein